MTRETRTQPKNVRLWDFASEIEDSLSAYGLSERSHYCDSLNSTFRTAPTSRQLSDSEQHFRAGVPNFRIADHPGVIPRASSVNPGQGKGSRSDTLVPQPSSLTSGCRVRKMKRATGWSFAGRLVNEPSFDVPWFAQPQPPVRRTFGLNQETSV